jgi:signal transduction histidine kinase
MTALASTWTGGPVETTPLILDSMRERLTLVHGEMTIESTPGAGTALFIVLPMVTKTEEAQL